MSKLEKHLICGIHITDRVAHVTEVQDTLTAYGKYIKTRIGLHELDIDDEYSSPNGLLVVEFVNEPKLTEFSKRLKEIDGVEVKHMIFEHP